MYSPPSRVVYKYSIVHYSLSKWKAVNESINTFLSVIVKSMREQ